MPSRRCGYTDVLRCRRGSDVNLPSMCPDCRFWIVSSTTTVFSTKQILESNEAGSGRLIRLSDCRAVGVAIVSYRLPNVRLRRLYSASTSIACLS